MKNNLKLFCKVFILKFVKNKKIREMKIVKTPTLNFYKDKRSIKKKIPVFKSN